jgi:hypothetical protein
MDRRDFVRASGATVALMTGCVGGDSPDGDDGETNATDGGGNGSDVGSNQTETEGEDSGADGQEETGEEEDAEEEGEESESGYEEAGYTRFMYDPEQAGVDADGYVFTHVGADASRELTERVLGTADSAKRIARVEIRDTGEGSEEGDISEGGGREIVEMRVYEQESSLKELGGTLTEPVDSRAGYDVYDSGGSAVGVNRESLTIIEASTTDRVRLVAETIEGETPSYAESSEDLRLLTNTVGTGEAVLIRGQLPESDTPGVESAIASSLALSEDDRTVSIRYAVVYPDEEGANAAVSPDSLEQEAPDGTDAPPDGMIEGSSKEGDTPSDQLTPLFALAATELAPVTEVAVSPENVEVSDQTADGRVAILKATAESKALFED